MVHALGFSQTEFDAADPGRLCRGRERWIEPWEMEEPQWMHRLVVSGATFSDDSASDALRGLPHSEVDMAALLVALFPRRDLLAFMEDGHPADIPEAADGVELYEGYRAGGRAQEVFVRWHKRVSGVREIRDLVGEGGQVDNVRGFAVLAGDEDLPRLLDKLFLLTGLSNVDSPPARFQPAALVDVLEEVRAVVLVHRDKHGPAVGIYSREPIKTEGRLEPLCEKASTLLVRFAIPPMLARWDRALAEVRAEWMATRSDEFPVPPAPEPSGWEPRRRDRRDRRRGADEHADLGPDGVLDEAAEHGEE